MKNLKQEVKKLREEAGLSPTELSERSELSLGFIIKLEGGEYNSLKLSTCKALANGLGLTLRDFLDKIGFLDEKKEEPDFKQVIRNALRTNGYNIKQANDILNYAEFKRQKL